MKLRHLGLCAGLGALVALQPATGSTQERYVLPGSLPDRILQFADLADPVLAAAIRRGAFLPQDARAQSIIDMLATAKLLEAKGYLRMPVPADTAPQASDPADEDDVDGDLGDLGPDETYKDRPEYRSSYDVAMEQLQEIALREKGLADDQLAELERQNTEAIMNLHRFRAEWLLDQHAAYMRGDPNFFEKYFREMYEQAVEAAKTGMGIDPRSGQPFNADVLRDLAGDFKDVIFDISAITVDPSDDFVDPAEGTMQPVPDQQVLGEDFFELQQALEQALVNISGPATGVKPPPPMDEQDKEEVLDPLVDGYWTDDPDGTDADITEVQPSSAELSERWKEYLKRLEEKYAEIEREAAEEARAKTEAKAEEPEYDTAGQLPGSGPAYEEVEIDTSGVVLPDEVKAAISSASCSALPTANLCRNIAEPYKAACLQAQTEAAAQNCAAAAPQGETCVASCQRNAAGMRRDETLLGFARATVETNYERMRATLSAYPNFAQARPTLDRWRDTAMSRWQAGAADLAPGQYCTGAEIDDWEAQCLSACSTNGDDPQTSLCRNGIGSAALAAPTSAVHLIPPGYFSEVASK